MLKYEGFRARLLGNHFLIHFESLKVVESKTTLLIYEDKDTLLTLSINYRNMFLIFKKPEKEGSQRMTIVTGKLRILSFKSTIREENRNHNRSKNSF